MSAVEEILVLGDSHVSLFRHMKFRACFPNYFFNVKDIGGATVSGLENPNSTTQALPIFLNALRNSNARTTIVQLGEVDTGFVIWYRAEKYDLPVDAMLERAIINYQNLLREIARKSRVICLSTALPTIQDDQQWGEVANARSSIKATQLQRTELTLRFNIIMQEFCELNGYIYLSFDAESLGDNGLVSKHLLNSDKQNHHYDAGIYAGMILDRLRTSLEQGAPPDDKSATLHCRS